MFLLYNKVSQPYIYKYPLRPGPLAFHPLPTPLGHHRALSWASWAMQKLPDGYLFTRGSADMSISVSQYPSPLPSPLCLHVCSLCLTLTFAWPSPVWPFNCSNLASDYPLERKPYSKWDLLENQCLKSDLKHTLSLYIYFLNKFFPMVVYSCRLLIIDCSPKKVLWTCYAPCNGRVT